MNPDIFNNPEKFIFPLIQARQAEQELKDKLLDVQDDFALKQAALGWVLDNPWIFALLLRREVSRIETPVFIKMKEELAACQSGEAMRALEGELARLKTENEALRSFPKKLYDAVTMNICNAFHENPFKDEKEATEFKSNAFNAINKMFTDAGAPADLLINDCPPAQGTPTSTGSNSGSGSGPTPPSPTGTGGSNPMLIIKPV